MLIKRYIPFKYGYNKVAAMDGEHGYTLMDFGILKLGENLYESDCTRLERAYLLIRGKVLFEWEGRRIIVEREDCFNENPWCLHVPSGVKVKVSSLIDYSEIAVHKTDNNKNFTSRLYTPDECRSELRGKGTLNETSTRNVRTIFDKSNAEYSNLVLGEVIDFPGKWSSYPPHYHPQPEIYFYKFSPENGFGYSELGEKVVKVKNNYTVTIEGGLTHPQVTAPGYAMYYLWVIRHLDNEPYITPVYEHEHLWVVKE